MKVVQVNSFFGRGSTGGIVRDIADACNDAGITSYVATMESHTDLPNCIRVGNFIDHKIHALLGRIYGKQGYFSVSATRFFIKKLKQINPDIVHLHNIHSNFINLPLLLSFLAQNKITTVITLHDCWFYTGGCFHYSNVGCFKWQEKCEKCPKQLQDTPAYFGDKCTEIYEDRKKYLINIPNLHIVGVSNWVSNEARKSFLSNKDIRTIHNGINLDVYKPVDSDWRNKLGLENKRVILGPASKWLDAVNNNVLDYFVQNMNSDEMLLIYGASNTSQCISDKVKLIGFISDKHEMAALYSMADVFANCTREDTLSLINLEAQACGTPVVTFDATGPKETVDEKYSFTVTCGDAKALLQKVREVTKNEVTSQESRTFIVNHFEKKSKTSEYINLYKAIAGNER